MSNNHEILDAGLAHFKSLVDGGLKPVEVKAWGTTVYCGPLTPEQHDACQLAAKMSSSAWGIEVLVQRARDAEGKPVFHKADKPTMRKMLDMNVVAELALAIDDAWKSPEPEHTPTVGTAKNS